MIELGEDGRKPMEKILQKEIPPDLSAFHTWGCPVFVLDHRLQGDSKIPKWEPRARVGVFMGHSPVHAGNVALVLNLQTRHVSLQFHVVFDDIFSTVEYIRYTQEPPFWEDLVKKPFSTCHRGSL